jgi:hypothetical protein
MRAGVEESRREWRRGWSVVCRAFGGIPCSVFRPRLPSCFQIHLPTCSKRQSVEGLKVSRSKVLKSQGRGCHGCHCCHGCRSTPGLPSSVLGLLSSVLGLLSSVIRPRSSVFRHPSSVLGLRSSVLRQNSRFSDSRLFPLMCYGAFRKPRAGALGSLTECPLDIRPAGT